MAEDIDFAGLRHFRARGEEQRATALELFFDLVFVFAVTQLSHALLELLTVTGAARTLFLLLLVWWAWTYTTWMTNFMDPDSPLVRLLLMSVMLASLLMAIALPQAFGSRAVLFAGAYVAVQVLRNLFITLMSPAGSGLRNNFGSILVWSAVSGAALLTGAFLDPPGRTVLWVVAIAIDFAGPAARYWVPGLPRVTTHDWAVETSHFAERFQLFIIIALGESIVATGATASQGGLGLAKAVAIAVAFVGSAALWWLYFDYVAEISGRRLRTADDPGVLARDAYTYLHIPIVAGIIVTAVGDEIVIAHPGGSLGAAELVALAAGPAIYLVGHLLFRVRMAHSLSPLRSGAAVAVCACGLVGLAAPALAVAALIAGVLVLLVAAEMLAGRRRRLRGLPGPIEALEGLLARDAPPASSSTLD
jgi:low temperature requirement protein LtrA